jgi:hypothetical protein
MKSLPLVAKVLWAMLYTHRHLWSKQKGSVAAWVLLPLKHESWPCPGQFPWIHSPVISWRCVCHYTAHQAYAYGPFLQLVLALAFHPTPSLLGWSSTPLTLRVEELRASDVHSKTWRSLALRCLQGVVSLFCGSMASLQAAIMLLLDGQEGSLALDTILVTAISGAQKLGLHRLGDARLEASASPPSPSEDGSSTSTEPPHIRTEIGIRIW